MKVRVSKSGSQTPSESFLNMEIFFFIAAIPKAYKIYPLIQCKERNWS